MANGVPSSELAEAIIASAGRLGINPSDLATAISYETAGTFDPWAPGPRTQWGQHRGLIQWGEPQRKRYGVTADMSVADQMKAAEAYLKDAGVRPGMGLLDVYSAINAGKVGLYNRSDAHNGGAPGTVADKVASMVGHRARATALLNGESFNLARSGADPARGSGAVARATGGGDPLRAMTASLISGGNAAPAAGSSPSAMLEALQRIPGMMQNDMPAAPQMPSAAGLARARQIARAAALRSIAATAAA